MDRLTLGSTLTDVEINADRIPRSQQSKSHTWFSRCEGGVVSFFGFFFNCGLAHHRECTVKLTKLVLTWWRDGMYHYGLPDVSVKKQT